MDNGKNDKSSKGLAKNNNSANRLYYGDNLDILRKKIKDETVDLCYIDPPFNSKRSYNQIYNNVGGDDHAQAQAFIDTWTWDDRANAGYGEILENAVGRFQPQTVELIKGLHAVLQEGNLSNEYVTPKEGWEYKAVSPSTGRYWAYSRENMTNFAIDNRLHYFSSGMPRLKQYAADLAGIGLQDVWTDVYPINSQAQERLGYPTQKPEALMDRIIQTSSNEGDLILDAYCGCGTTVAVAQRLKRRWIGMDITFQSIALVLKRLEDTFGEDVAADVMLDGIPKDMASAVALARKKDDRLRKEFEKWAVLTYTNNRAVINEKKGADAGIDARAYFTTGRRDNAKIIFQVKSGGVKRDDIATLRGDMERERAALAVLITLEEPSRPMITEAKTAGQYRHEEMGRSYDRISIVRIREIIEDGKRLEIPMSLEVLKAARSPVGEQFQLLPV